MPSKSKNQKYHARKRMLERHGLTFGPNTQREFVIQIQKGKAKFIKKVSNRVTIWWVIHEGTSYRVVYDKNTHNIVTVLPSTGKGKVPMGKDYFGFITSSAIVIIIGTDRLKVESNYQLSRLNQCEISNKKIARFTCSPDGSTITVTGFEPKAPHYQAIKKEVAELESQTTDEIFVRVHTTKIEQMFVKA